MVQGQLSADFITLHFATLASKMKPNQELPIYVEENVSHGITRAETMLPSRMPLSLVLNNAFALGGPNTWLAVLQELHELPK